MGQAQAATHEACGMKTIVCPVDFSPCSESAAVYGARLAAGFNSLFILVHVYKSALGYPDEPLHAIPVIDEVIQRSVEEELEKLKAMLLKENKNLRIGIRIKEGNVPEEIRLLAEKEDADLVVMGAKGNGNAAGVLASSTLLHFIPKAHCPVLCIPENQDYKGIRKIVFATDLKEDNIHAALNIVAFAKHFDAEIIFLFVDSQYLVHTDESIAEMTRKIRSKVRFPKMSGYVVKSTGIQEGIDYFLKKQPADLLVMVTHERRFPQSLAKKGLTKKMARHLSIPLIAFPEKAHTLVDVSEDSL